IGRLDPSVGGSGPHGLTVRTRPARLAARPRPSHPALDVRDDRDAPSCECGTGRSGLDHIFRFSERDIFLRKGLASSGKTGGVFSVARRVATATLLPRAHSDPSSAVHHLLSVL